MKTLALNDILTQIGGGKIIQGSGNPHIHHVLNYAKKELKNNTLIFHMDEERIRGKYWNDFSSIVLITDKPELCTDLNDSIIVITTDHLQEGYWRFVNYYRSLFHLPVIGVTGTCGKSTTKEMIRQMLLEDYNVQATWMSMNSMSVNLRYLTGINEDTEVAVFEMPVAYPGYLKVACDYFKPKIGIILNIDVHHLADCKTPQEYMKAKAELAEGLDPEDGILILNADDENIKKVVDISRHKKVIYFGTNENSHFRAKNVKYIDGGMSFIMEHKEKEYEVFVPGYGEHNIYNAMAAIAAVTEVGMTIHDAINKLSSFVHLEEHLELKKGANGCTIIDDTWNAAPLSMATGLHVLKNISKDKKTVALLGYMPQLGDGPFAAEQYKKMGKKAAETDVDLLVVVGDEAQDIGRGAIEAGLNPESIHYCQTGDEVHSSILPYLNEDSFMLLKVTHRVMKRPTFIELRKKLMLEEIE